MLVKMETGASGGGGNYFEPTLVPASELSTSSYKSIDAGFTIHDVVIYANVSGNNIVTVWYDVDNSTIYYTSQSQGKFESTTEAASWLGTVLVVEGTVFKYKPPSSAWVVNTRLFIV